MGGCAARRHPGLDRAPSLIAEASIRARSLLPGRGILRAVGLFALTLSVACTEQLTTAADCPALCPGQPVQYRDTVLTVTSDLAVAGYSVSRTITSVLVSNGGDYGEHRGVIRFTPRPDSLFVDSLLPFESIDSIFIELVPQAWDTTVTDQYLDVYRLPSTTDTLATFAEVDGAMTEATFLTSVQITGPSTPTPTYLLFTGDDLAKFTFAAGEPRSLAIGLRLRSSQPTGIRIGASASGSAGPSWTTWVTLRVADTLENNFIQRNGGLEFTVVGTPPSSHDALRIGGLPVSRGFLRFTLPDFLRDSVVLVRATLLLGLDHPIVGIPGDSTTLLVHTLIGDLGPKSPVYPSIFGGAMLTSGQTEAMEIEVLDLVRLWQGGIRLPSILRVMIVEEGSTFTVPHLRSLTSGLGEPRLRLTYRPHFQFGGY